MNFWLIAGVVAVSALCLWNLRRMHREVGKLCGILNRLAEGETAPAVTAWKPRMFRALGPDLERIRERLENLDQQATDEGFSLRAILKGIVEGVIILDSGDTVRLANEAVISMFGLRRSPLNKSVLEVFQNMDLRHAVRETRETGKPQLLVIRVQQFAEGRPVEKYFEVNSVALESVRASEPVGVIAVFHDISELKTLESVRRELVGNVSHELRTPLSIIKGYIETLLDGAMDEPEVAERFLQTMKRHTDRLNLLIEDLATISLLESRTTHLDLENVSLPEIARGVVERFVPEIGTRSASVTIEDTPEIPIIEADPHRMDQVFFNLIDNALKYARDTTPCIRVVFKTADDKVRVEVQDNGPGIPVEDQTHIFERFYRVHKDRSRHAGGTGLGLSIVKHTVLAHGGTVGVTSSPGNGASFWLELPVAQTSRDESDTHAPARDRGPV